MQATGLYDNLVLKTPILGDAVEMGLEVVAKTLECLDGLDDVLVDDLEYNDSNNDWLPSEKKSL